MNKLQEELVEKIQKLKKEKNAIILAHNYVYGEVQDIADFVGDSLELSIKAKDVKEDIIVFCGVKFMAETAKILSPEKTVLLPVLEAGCPMADMATSTEVLKMKEKYPNAVTVAYVNSTADLKSVVDICCTSANAEQIVSTIPKDKEIIFLPDMNLGANVAKKLDREIILWEGYCPTHMRLSVEMIEKKKKEFPNAVAIIHPECPPEMVEQSDYSLSTGGMLKFAKETDAKEIIVCTELGITHRLAKENPEKMFIPVSEQAICATMKMIELKDVYNSLKEMKNEIILDNEIIEKAVLPIERMIKGKL